MTLYVFKGGFRKKFIMEKTETLYNLTHYNIRPDKKYGQNFLTDDDILDGIVEAAGVTKDDTVLEIGPGLGALTKRLSKAAGKVVAVEIDEKLIMLLEETVGKEENVTIINQDILKTDICEIVSGTRGRLKVVANLPYYITSPIVVKLLEESRKDGEVFIDSITVMVQKEVAERLTSGPGTKDYGAITLFAQYYAETEIKIDVPPESFMPPPAVNSSVINMKILPEPPVSTKDEELMMKLIRASFNQRRKTLLNGIKNSPELSISKEKAEEALEKMEKPLTVRGETFTLEEFAELSDMLL